ncbi:uncharacterized protein LOC110007361 isoform X1 [Amborella trichopoda]|uniref:uncharacterized protein LOC110007361 isoform X1 n=1 Tax=Amborella trichopoda TaxID=13333 RepID=UPI0009BF06A7|nr:uncharacterized protein LOC110007361 isoform X1 [Amborella trichopoda]|eukprot:XP_020523520.1 uncharacterized protein LOC110007361 isoform X1 [Amborella trichopoda]
MASWVQCFKRQEKPGWIHGKCRVQGYWHNVADCMLNINLSLDEVRPEDSRNRVGHARTHGTPTAETSTSLPCSNQPQGYVDLTEASGQHASSSAQHNEVTSLAVDNHDISKASCERTNQDTSETQIHGSAMADTSSSNEPQGHVALTQASGQHASSSTQENSMTQFDPFHYGLLLGNQNISEATCESPYQGINHAWIRGGAVADTISSNQPQVDVDLTIEADNQNIGEARCESRNQEIRQRWRHGSAMADTVSSNQPQVEVDLTIEVDNQNISEARCESRNQEIRQRWRHGSARADTSSSN